MAAMAPAVIDFGELLKDVPPGAWVALSHDEKTVIAYAAEVRDVIEAAREKGEEFPVVLRAPLSPSVLFLWTSTENVECRTL